jgi:hypothetical protein
MTKIEFMAMSLPYGLKCQRKNGFLGISRIDHYLYKYISDSENDPQLEKFNLILRPISDLTKTIEHNGEKFIPIRMLENTHGIEYLKKYLREQDSPNIYGKHFNTYELKFGALSKLIKLHFDVYSLIEKGEAIDVNSLNENPYKWKQ